MLVLHEVEKLTWCALRKDNYYTKVPSVSSPHSASCRERTALLSVPANIIVNLVPIFIVNQYFIVDHIDDSACAPYGNSEKNYGGQNTAQKYDCQDYGCHATASMTVATLIIPTPTVAALMLLSSGYNNGGMLGRSNDGRPRSNRDIGCPVRI